MVNDGLHADRGCDVCLAGAGATNENDVLGVVEELAAMQGLHLGDADAAFGKIEARKIPVCREACDLHLVVDGAHLAFGHFGLDELLEQLAGLLKRRRSLFGQLRDGTGHAVQLHRLQCGMSA